MALPRTEDTKLGAQALAYVTKLYQELTVENGAPTLGSQNQAVEFIRSDAELRRAVAAWAETVNIDERQWRRDGTCRWYALQPTRAYYRTDHGSGSLPLSSDGR